MEPLRPLVDRGVLKFVQVAQTAAASPEIFPTRIYEPRICIGIATGESITSSIGAKERRNYTVIGDTGNLASRIEGANRL